MTILDTNVISELMRSAPDERVSTWVTARPAADLFATSISEAEILYGIELLPKGRRRESLARLARALFDEDFEHRVLAFDSQAAELYSEIAGARRRSGRPISTLDAQIAAITRAHGATLATRNVSDFDGCGIEVVDPWSAD